MEFRTVSDQKIITDFLMASAAGCGAEFLVSKEWADILQREEKVEALGIYDGEKLLALFNSIKKDFKFGLSYYYLPRGPIFAKDLPAEKQLEIWQLLISEFKKRRGIFLRVEPKDFLPSNIKALPSINLQPKETLMLDLSLSEEELLKSFHQKTRYNIRLAEKKGVVVREGQGEKDFASFWSLMTETGKRDKFHIHNQNHYQLLATANPNFIKLFITEINGQTIAAGLFSFYGDKVTYLHGASAHEFRQLMAPYLLQWTLIKKAKESGYKYYDFYGIDVQKWPGVTRFKTGFGGFTVSYAGTHDIILNYFAYNLYNILRRIRRLV